MKTDQCTCTCCRACEAALSLVEAATEGEEMGDTLIGILQAAAIVTVDWAPPGSEKSQKVALLQNVAAAYDEALRQKWAFEATEVMH